MHKSVLLGETIQFLDLKDGDVVVDATVGSGGHTKELARKVGDSGKVISIDVDQSAIDFAKKRLTEQDKDLLNRVVFVHDNFCNLEKIVQQEGLSGVNAILADLGWRIEQIEDPKRGMSFLREAKLDMRLDQERNSLTAHEIVNEWSEKKLRDIFWGFGEEKNAKTIVAEIVRKRKEKQIETTTQLAEIVESKCVARKKGRLHCATKVFQALRIAVNDELGNLEKFLTQSVSVLEKKGRIAVISFHSLEDRIVKKFFQTNARGCVCPKEFPVCICKGKSKLKILMRKPIVAGEDELKQNKRSRSAKLRVAQKI
ncbi:MAG: 16S rRNA (cytosine(1402)-N(4))-methyltransferase RsmH [Patescibacteria group bacterium]|nr:16S rRNA (cytosine(1402)-N(4))-methyltransferase RsmH [Patescibacteria group bacterium]